VSVARRWGCRVLGEERLGLPWAEVVPWGSAEPLGQDGSTSGKASLRKHKVLHRQRGVMGKEVRNSPASTWAREVSHCCIHRQKPHLGMTYLFFRVHRNSL